MINVAYFQNVWQECGETKVHGILFFLTGRAVRDGREADLHEAAAGEPLHADPRLFQDLLLRAVSLHSL